MSKWLAILLLIQFAGAAVEPTSGWYCQDNKAWWAFRKISHMNKLLIAVDPINLQSKILDHAMPCPAPPLASNDGYFKLLQYPYHGEAQDVGWANAQVHGYFLTMDLCPSHRVLDRVQLERLIERFGTVPIGVSISGAWMRQHGQDLEWLKEQNELGHLRITWVNHTDHHTITGLGPQEMFLQAPGTHVESELLGAENEMLNHGILPSVFARFPGLEADVHVVQVTKTLGLIPLAAGAWMAKGESLDMGDIVLVHGNGNEPRGWHMLQDSIAHREVKWLDLSQLAGVPVFTPQKPRSHD